MGSIKRDEMILIKIVLGIILTGTVTCEDNTGCPNGWTAGSNKCYKLISEPFSLWQADEQCKNINGSVIVPETVAEYEEIGNLAGLGLDFEGDHFWIFFKILSTYKTDFPPTVVKVDGSPAPDWINDNKNQFYYGELTGPKGLISAQTFIESGKNRRIGLQYFQSNAGRLSLYKPNNPRLFGAYALCEITRKITTKNRTNIVRNYDGKWTKYFTGGDSTYCSHSREAIMNFHCGDINKLIDVKEPRECNYIINFVINCNNEVSISSTIKLPADYIHTQQSFGTMFYKFYGKMNRYSAKSTCERDGAILPIPRSKIENDFIANLKPYGDIWLGINHINNENFTDPYGKPITYFNWASGEPNNYYGGEDAVYIVGNTGYHYNEQPTLWNDAPSTISTRVYAICVFYPQETPNDETWAEYLDTYLLYYTSQYQKFSTLAEAQQKCAELSFDECGGITYVKNVGYELRNGNDPISSPIGEISYVRPRT